MSTRAFQTRWLKSRVFGAPETGTTFVALEIPAKTIVNKVVCLITTALGGGSPSIDVGDGDTSDGWIKSADITEGTTGLWAGDETTTAAYILGKYYDVADTIDVVLAASLTSGAFYILAETIDLSGEV